jgi:glycerol-3-phosphate acyltransferase PlsY
MFRGRVSTNHQRGQRADTQRGRKHTAYSSSLVNTSGGFVLMISHWSRAALPLPFLACTLTHMFSSSSSCCAGHSRLLVAVLPLVQCTLVYIVLRERWTMRLLML